MKPKEQLDDFEKWAFKEGVLLSHAVHGYRACWQAAQAQQAERLRVALNMRKDEFNCPICYDDPRHAKLMDAAKLAVLALENHTRQTRPLLQTEQAILALKAAGVEP